MISPLYGQLSPLRIPTSSRFISADADVSAYILAVEAADGQQLEDGVITAVESFVLGCKSDGIWSAIKAACIIAGARTLSGALKPLVGTAPTNSNFVSGDYDRKTGLVGDGTTKNLNSNRAGNADPQDNVHQCIYLTSPPTVNVTRFIIGTPASPATYLTSSVGSQLGSRNRTGSTFLFGSSTSVGFKGHSRSLAASYIHRAGGINSNRATASAGNPAANHFVFSAGQSGSFNGRIAYYSIGESLDLAALDLRVSTLMTELASAIP